MPIRSPTSRPLGERVLGSPFRDVLDSLPLTGPFGRCRQYTLAPGYTHYRRALEPNPSYDRGRYGVCGAWAFPVDRWLQPHKWRSNFLGHSLVLRIPQALSRTFFSSGVYAVF